MMQSSTSAGLIPARSTACLMAWPPRTGASVSLKAPRKDLPSAVRAVETMTASVMMGPYLKLGLALLSESFARLDGVRAEIGLQGKALLPAVIILELAVGRNAGQRFLG